MMIVVTRLDNINVDLLLLEQDFDINAKGEFHNSDHLLIGAVFLLFL